MVEGLVGAAVAGRGEGLVDGTGTLDPAAVGTDVEIVIDCSLTAVTVKRVLNVSLDTVRLNAVRNSEVVGGRFNTALSEQ
jgi:hypothetical protein